MVYMLQSNSGMYGTAAPMIGASRQLAPEQAHASHPPSNPIQGTSEPFPMLASTFRFQFW
eukprot:1550248-Rhodomonas_salina.1